MSSSLKINRLLITSVSQNYNLEFKEGINIVSGPRFTGKSTIFSLINYALGAGEYTKIPHLSGCSDVMLELEVDKHVFTFQRSLKNEKSDAYFFQNSIQEILEKHTIGEEVLPKAILGKKSISSILMNYLGLAESVVKLANRKDSSEAHTLSFRDIFKLLYVDQRRIASEKFFFEDDHILNMKTLASIEHFWNLYDDQKAIVGNQIKSTERDIEQLEKDLKLTVKFLNELKIPRLDTIEEKIIELDKDIRKLALEKVELGAAAKDRLGKDYRIVDIINDLQKQISDNDFKIKDLNRSILNLEKLSIQYEREHEQLLFLEEGGLALMGIPVVICPSCFQSLESGEHDKTTCGTCLKPVPAIDNETILKSRILSVKLRQKDLKSFILDSSKERERTKNLVIKDRAEVVKYEKELNDLHSIYLIKQTQEAVDLEKRIQIKKQEHDNYIQYKNYRLRANGEGSNLALLNDKLNGLREKIAEMSDDTVSRDEVIKDLTTKFSSILKTLGLPENINPHINDKFIPILRGEHYSQLSSLGTIALTLTGYLFAFLFRSLEKNTSFPRLIMIDSPLNHLGRDEQNALFPDQVSVNEFYKMLDGLESTKKDKFQVIIIDNKAPTKYSHLVNIQFTGVEGQGRAGLISIEEKK